MSINYFIEFISKSMFPTQTHHFHNYRTKSVHMEVFRGCGSPEWLGTTIISCFFNRRGSSMAFLSEQDPEKGGVNLEELDRLLTDLEKFTTTFDISFEEVLTAYNMLADRSRIMDP